MNKPLAHLISYVSTCLDNHREKGKLLELYKGTPAQPEIKIDEVKTFKYLSCVVCQMHN